MMRSLIVRLSPQIRRVLISGAPLLFAACAAGGGNDSSGEDTGESGDGDTSTVPPNMDEVFLTECVGAECPSGTREGVRATCETSNVGARLLRRLTRSELDRTLRDIFPEVVDSWGGVELTQDPQSSLGFSTDAKVLVVNGPTFKNLLDTSEGLAELVTTPDTLGALLPCASSSPDAACSEEFVNRYGQRLFRRPLTEAETARYVNYQTSVADRSDFQTGLKWALSVMMQSPHAIYRSEIGEAAREGTRLTQYELATNLAYTYSGTTPTPELLAQAAAGAFSDGAALEAAATALLDDSANWESAREFFREWLGYQRVLNQSRDKEPDFAATISPLLVEETRLFLDQILFAGGTAQSLMTADFTALDSTLSEFYGFGSVAAGFEAVTRPADRGKGILAQGSILASTSHQKETSPTLRGLLFTEGFLCVEPPPPPDIVPPLAEAEGIENAKTTRQKYELHHGVGACANCHKNFDPYGFTFEQFDETGRYRADEAGEPIDTVASVILPDGSSMEFADLDALTNYVNQSDEIENCVSGLMATYFLSGGGGANCLAEESRRALAAGEITLRQYLASLAASPHFSTRGH